MAPHTPSSDATVSPGPLTASTSASKGKAKDTAAGASLSTQRIATGTASQRQVMGATHQGNMGTIRPPAVTAPLSLYSYEEYQPKPEVKYVRSEQEANNLVPSLSVPLGFDLEWVVTFSPGGPRQGISKPTGLVQICDSRIILLIQVSAMQTFPHKLKEVIEDKNVKKLGANILNDGNKLLRDFGVRSRNLVELGDLAHQADPKCPFTFNYYSIALARVVEQYTNKTLSKGSVRLSDWDGELTEEQKTYAANDAHCALIVYNRLIELAKENKREIRWEACSRDVAEVPQGTSRPAPTTASTKAAPHVTSTNPVVEVADASISSTQTSISVLGTSSTMPQEPISIRPPVDATETLPSISTATVSTQPSASVTTSLSTIPATVHMPQESVSFPSSTHYSETPTSRLKAVPTTCQSSATKYHPYNTRLRGGPRPQDLEAYAMWHTEEISLDEMCARLGSGEKPLKRIVVITCVVRALQADSTLPFSMDRLKAFVKLDRASWEHHRDWILKKQRSMK